MYCLKCGVENPEEALFCKNCGFQFQKDDFIKCSSCGSLNSQNTKFCRECGKSLTGDSKVGDRDVSYRFYLNAPNASKKTAIKFQIDKKIVFEGLLIDGFDFNHVVKRGKDHYHIIEIFIVKKGFSDLELKDFSQKLNFELINGDLVEFEHHVVYVPFMSDYISIKP